MDVLSEIDNALRQDQFKALWKKYGSTALTALLAFLVVVACYQVYKGWQHNRNAQATDALISALQTQDTKPLADFSHKASGIHKVIADFIVANREKDMSKRAVLLEEISQSSNAPRDFRDLATIMKLRVSAPKNKEEAQKQAQALGRIANDKRAAFSMLARLDLSTVQARSLDDLKAARDSLAPILNGHDIPPEILEQARALDRVYRLDLEHQ